MATSKKTGKQSTAPKRKTKRSSQENGQKVQKQNFLRDEIFILVSLALCIFLTISHFGIGGTVGNAASDFLFGVFGFLAYLVPILSFIGIAFVFSNKGNTNKT